MEKWEECNVLSEDQILCIQSRFNETIQKAEQLLAHTYLQELGEAEWIKSFVENTIKYAVLYDLNNAMEEILNSGKINNNK